MTSRVPVRIIKPALQGRVHALVRALGIDVGARSGSYVGRNPTRDDRHAGSFKIWLVGNSPGAWKDYASNDKGDVIDLIAYLKRCERGDAIAWAADWLGLAAVDPATLERMRRDAMREREVAERRTREADHAKVRRAFEMWMASDTHLEGTPVDTYLAARGIPLGQVPNLADGEIRFRPALEWWKGAERRDGRKVRSGPSFPAMVCAIRSRAGDVVAVHCTFLAPDGRGKAPVDAPKLMYGLVAGGVIRLTHGPFGLSPEEAAAAGISGLLATGEGVEDGLSIARAAPEARVWAATSLGNLGHVPLDHPCVSAAIVARDNDWGKAQARRAFDAAILALERHDKPIAVTGSHHGKDFNDCLAGDA